MKFRGHFYNEMLAAETIGSTIYSKNIGELY